MAYTTRKRSKARVYIYRLFILSIVCAISYGAYTGYKYIKPTVTPTNTMQLSSAQSRELEAIMNSQAFKAKAQNLAEQQLLNDRIANKQKAIKDLENEIGTLKKDLEDKRVASLSL